MNFGSLFSGVGGMDLGLEWAGMECAWYVEIEDYFSRVLEKHQPNIPRYGDVRDVGRHNLEPVDLISGGFPCQPHSVAGKRRGAKDDRNLWPEFSRIIGEMRPRYVLAENVPGIITTYLDTVLSDLESQGYTPWPFNIPACAFDAPHRRERIFIVAHNTDSSRESQIKGMEARNSADSKRVCGNVADADGTRELQPQGSKQNQRERIINSSPEICNTAIQGLQNRTDIKMGKPREISKPKRSDWWTVEPDMGRVAHGVPSRVDRLRALGNAVVPQVAEWIGRRIIEHARSSA